MQLVRGISIASRLAQNVVTSLAATALKSDICHDVCGYEYAPIWPLKFR